MTGGRLNKEFYVKNRDTASISVSSRGNLRAIQEARAQRLAYMPTVVANENAMIRTETLQSVLGEEATVVTAALESTDDIIEAAGDAVGLVVDVNTPVPTEVFEGCPDLQIVARAGVGVDQIDFEAAVEHDVTVVNVPDYCTEEVSTHAVSLLLAGVRRLTEYNGAIEDGSWNWTDGQPIHRLNTQTIGFLSFGGLAKRTAEKLSGLDCRMVAADPYVEAEDMEPYGVEKVAFDELFEEPIISRFMRRSLMRHTTFSTKRRSNG